MHNQINVQTLSGSLAFYIRATNPHHPRFRYLHPPPHPLAVILLTLGAHLLLAGPAAPLHIRIQQLTPRNLAPLTSIPLRGPLLFILTLQVAYGLLIDPITPLSVMFLSPLLTLSRPSHLSFLPRRVGGGIGPLVVIKAGPVIQGGVACFVRANRCLPIHSYISI